MNTTRNGKIARLPRAIRDQLSQRIDNGEPGPELADWLNTLPEVQSVLAERFAGRPINTQNITEWRQGGYQDWLQLQEHRALTLYLAEHSESLDTDLGAKKISDAYATIAAAEFVNNSRAKLKETTDTNQRYECICDIQNKLSRLRRDDYRAGHLKLRQDQWDYQVAADQRAAEQAAADEERRQELAFFQLTPTLKEHCQQFGGTDEARDLSAYILELEHNLKQGTLGRRAPLPTFVTDSEGRVIRVPNPAPTTPTPSTAPVPPDAKPDLAPVALANEAWPPPAEIRLENREKMPVIRVNQAAGECSKNNEPRAHTSRQPATSLCTHGKNNALASWSAADLRRFPSDSQPSSTSNLENK